jgi:protein gp37
MERSAIEWTDATFNPWIGCTKVSPGCDHCYAEAREDTRLHRVRWGAGEPRYRTSADNWKNPGRWNKQPFFECMTCGWRGTVGDGERRGCACHPANFRKARRRVFCASLADIFDNEVPAEWRKDLLELIAATPNLDWLLLTKRIRNAGRMLEAAIGELSHGRNTWEQNPWPNVWIGATIVDREEADRDIPKLLATPARVRFLSMEPLIGPVEFSNVTRRSDAVQQLGRPALSGIDWVIVGGESGPRARPMHPDWARSLRDQCAAVGVPFLFKQWGEWTPGENVERRTGTVDCAWWFDGRWTPGQESLARDDGHRDEQPDLYRIGKKAAGRVLDGRTHDAFPRGCDA